MSPSLRTRQRSRVLGDIQTAAWRLFAVAGYGSVTTKQIADAAGVSESTYFRHIANKDDLLLYPLAESSAAIVAAFAAQPPEIPVSRALANAIIERTEAASVTELEMWRDALVGVPELRDRIKLIRDSDARALIQLAAERLGMAADSLEPGTRVHIMLAAAAWAYRCWFDGDPRELRTLIEEATSIAVEPCH